jgi:hypothetical protein
VKRLDIKYQGGSEMKRRYEKPSMKVYDLKQKPMILVGSERPDQWGHTPGSPEEMNKLA